MRFDGYIGVDYSGAATANARLAALRVYRARPGDGEPEEVRAPGGRNWTRQELAAWLTETLGGEERWLVGVDHGFSFPRAYFEAHGLAGDWPGFLEDFCAHWPTDAPGVTVRDVRQGVAGAASRRGGRADWLRLTERWVPGAKSVFLFDVNGQVATSTHSGLPWLARLRRALGARGFFWPFDGWEPAAGASLVAEVYPSLWMRRYATAGRDGDQHAAYAVAAALRRADGDGSLARWLAPPLTPAERAQAAVEGWILGVG